MKLVGKSNTAFKTSDSTSMFEGPYSIVPSSFPAVQGSNLIRSRIVDFADCRRAVDSPQRGGVNME